MPVQKRFPLFLWASGMLGLAYIGYVVWAKLARTLGPPPIKLSETGEFLLFFSVIVSFTLQIVVEELRMPRAHAEHGEQ